MTGAQFKQFKDSWVKLRDLYLRQRALSMELLFHHEATDEMIVATVRSLARNCASLEASRQRLYDYARRTNQYHIQYMLGDPLK